MSKHFLSLASQIELKCRCLTPPPGYKAVPFKKTLRGPTVAKIHLNELARLVAKNLAAGKPFTVDPEANNCWTITIKDD
jgi:hypothetical protein